MRKKPAPVNKALAYMLLAGAILSALWSYFSITSMGFPDGHLTEFERLLKPLFIGYGMLALLFGILFYGVARFSNHARSRLIFYFSLSFFVLISIGVVVLYIYFSSKLDHGGGG